MDSFSNTLNRFKSLTFATVRGPSPPDPLRGARDSLLVAKCSPPPEPKSSLRHRLSLPKYSILSFSEIRVIKIDASVRMIKQ